MDDDVQARHRTGLELYHTFLSKGSQLTVNVSSDANLAMTAKFPALSCDVFDHAQVSVCIVNHICVLIVLVLIVLQWCSSDSAFYWIVGCLFALLYTSNSH